jgi:cyclase
MISGRVIPTLLLKDLGLVKGIQFQRHKYVGDAMNAVRIFNEKEADEIFLLDIGASARGTVINAEFVQRVADECYMPFGVGGGISTINQISGLVRSGAEKVSINTAALRRPDFIREAASHFGSQCVVVSIDVKRDWFGKWRVYSDSGKTKTHWLAHEWAKKAEELGAGEILLTSIADEGTGRGYNLDLVSDVSKVVGIPVIASGGAGAASDFKKAFSAGASAVAAGSLFVFKGLHRSVLIQYFKD